MSVNLTVNLDPPLTGYKGEMWVMLLVGGEGIWYYVMDIPLSVNGVIAFGYTDPYTINAHQIRFPEQTIDGVTYEATQTDGFMTTEDWIFNVPLTPKEEPPIPPIPPISPILILVGLGAYALLRGK